MRMTQRNVDQQKTNKQKEKQTTRKEKWFIRLVAELVNEFWKVDSEHTHYSLLQ